MKNKTTVHDRDPGLEAYRFQGVAQPFPNHFHEHYVIGLMEGGQRTLSCKGREYAVGPGSVLLFGPGDSHACAQCGGEMLDYRGLSVSQASMLNWTAETAGRRMLPGFSANAVQDGALAHALRKLHGLVMDGAGALRRRRPCCSCCPACSGNMDRPPRLGSRTYGEFVEKMAAVPERELAYLGIALCGPRKRVDRLTGSIPLLR